MSLGKSQGGSSQGASETRSFIAPFQQQALQRFFNNAEGTLSNIQQPFAEAGQQLGGQLNLRQNQITNNLANIARGTRGNNQFINTLGQLGSQSNPFLDQQIAGLGGDIQRQLQESLGNIGQGFVGAGQFGSGRQGLAEGEAITGALNEFGQQAANLRGQDLSRQAAAAQAGLGGQLQAGQIGQAGLPAAFNLGLAPFTSQLGLLSQFGGLLGDPTVLTESASSTRGRQGDLFSLGIL